MERKIYPVVLLIVVVVVGLVALTGCGGEEEVAPQEEEKPAKLPAKKVYNSPLAGMWYDADKERLSAEIEGYLANVEQEPLENVHGLILPHAGYRYSGQTAAYGVKQVAGKKFSRVIVIGPSHRLRMTNELSVPDATHYATPLGEIELDVEFMDRLKKHPQFRNIQRAHEGEHSVQIELPLLQKTLGKFVLVPIVVGRLDLETARAAGKILLGLIDEDTLIVASSDFTHYGPNFGYVPFSEDIPANLKKLAMGAFEKIRGKRVEDFFEHVSDTGDTICGRCPIMVLLQMLPPDSTAHLLHYDTSGRMTGDYRNSVSYLSIAFSGKWRTAHPGETKENEATLPESDKKQLLVLARKTLTYYLENGKAPTAEDLGIEIAPAMKKVMGAFVTLHKGGMLRGCIGEIFPRRPLYQAVMAHAVNAGVRDHRFRPVVLTEVHALDFEISALTPPRPVGSYNDIIIGKHGVVVEKNKRSAVYLPQVAPEQGWDVAQTLHHLCLKAGLPADAWKEGCSFTVFEAIVFGEKSK